MGWKVIEINPFNRPCCANCSNVIIRNEMDSQGLRHLSFRIACGCPHANEFPFKLLELSEKSKIENLQITEVGALLGYVCDSWEGHKEPKNLDRE